MVYTTPTFKEKFLFERLDEHRKALLDLVIKNFETSEPAESSL